MLTAFSRAYGDHLHALSLIGLSDVNLVSSEVDQTLFGNQL